MSTFDPRRNIQAGINSIGINRSATHGISALFQLGCDGEGCTNHVRQESREIIDSAYKQGFTTDDSVHKYAYTVLRERAYAAGWSTDRNGRDYCPDCIKQGRAKGGDMLRRGAGRRKAKR